MTRRRSCALALALCGALADEDVFVNVPAAPVTEWAQHLVLKLLCTLAAVYFLTLLYLTGIADLRPTLLLRLLVVFIGCLTILKLLP